MEGCWRLLLSGDAEGHYNMAVDDVLMESVREGCAPTLRLYGWVRPTLSLGRNQPGRGLYDTDRLAAAGVSIVRRQTGGRAVLHHYELTYSVVVQDRFFGSARKAYVAINSVLVTAVRKLGIEAAVHEPTASAPALSDTPCFAEPAGGEVVAGGRKLIGSAQVRREHVLLQHGSIPLERSRILDVLPSEVAGTLDGSAAYLNSLLPSAPASGALADAIVESWRQFIGPLRGDSLSRPELDRVSIHASHYLDDGWTWRR